MTILFALVQSRNEVFKPVAWIYFEIRFTPTRLWKNFKNSTKTLKVALNMKKSQNFLSFIWLTKGKVCATDKVCSLKGVKKNIKNIFSRQKWFFCKKSFLGPFGSENDGFL